MSTPAFAIAGIEETVWTAKADDPTLLFGKSVQSKAGSDPKASKKKSSEVTPRDSNVLNRTHSPIPRPVEPIARQLKDMSAQTDESDVDWSRLETPFHDAYYISQGDYTPVVNAEGTSASREGEFPWDPTPPKIIVPLNWTGNPAPTTPLVPAVTAEVSSASAPPKVKLSIQGLFRGAQSNDPEVRREDVQPTAGPPQPTQNVRQRTIKVDVRALFRGAPSNAQPPPQAAALAPASIPPSTLPTPPTSEPSHAPSAREEILQLDEVEDTPRVDTGEDTHPVDATEDAPQIDIVHQPDDDVLSVFSLPLDLEHHPDETFEPADRLTAPNLHSHTGEPTLRPRKSRNKKVKQWRRQVEGLDNEKVDQRKKEGTKEEKAQQSWVPIILCTFLFAGLMYFNLLPSLEALWKFVVEDCESELVRVVLEIGFAM